MKLGMILILLSSRGWQIICHIIYSISYINMADMLAINWSGFIPAGLVHSPLFLYINFYSCPDKSRDEIFLVDMYLYINFPLYLFRSHWFVFCQITIKNHGDFISMGYSVYKIVVYEAHAVHRKTHFLKMCQVSITWINSIIEENYRIIKQLHKWDKN